MSGAVGAEQNWLTAHQSLRCVRFNHAMGPNHSNEKETGEISKNNSKGQTMETLLGSVLGTLVVVPRAEWNRRTG